MKRSYVPLPIRVRVTPLAGVAHSLRTYPPIAKKHRSKTVIVVFKAFLFIFDLQNVEAGGSLAETSMFRNGGGMKAV